MKPLLKPLKRAELLQDLEPKPERAPSPAEPPRPPRPPLPTASNGRTPLVNPPESDPLTFPEPSAASCETGTAGFARRSTSTLAPRLSAVSIRCGVAGFVLRSKLDAGRCRSSTLSGVCWMRCVSRSTTGALLCLFRGERAAGSRIGVGRFTVWACCAWSWLPSLFAPRSRRSSPASGPCCVWSWLPPLFPESERQVHFYKSIAAHGLGCRLCLSRVHGGRRPRLGLAAHGLGCAADVRRSVGHVFSQWLLLSLVEGSFSHNSKSSKGV